MPLLLLELRSDYARTREMAARALGLLESPGQDVISALQQSIVDDDARVQWAAMRSLAALSADCDLLVSSLLQLLGTTERLWPWEAAVVYETLAECAPFNEAAVRALRRLLQEAVPQGLERQHIAGELAKQQSASLASTALLVELFMDADLPVAWSAARGLARSAPPELAASVFLLALDNESWVTRTAGAVGFGESGVASEEAVAGLTALLSDENEYVRIEAANSLGFLGEAGMGAVDLLIRNAREDPCPHVRAASVDALGRMGAPAADVLPALVDSSFDSEVFVLWASIRALGRYASDHADAREALRRLAVEGRPSVRHQAREALRRSTTAPR